MFCVVMGDITSNCIYSPLKPYTPGTETLFIQNGVCVSELWQVCKFKVIVQLYLVSTCHNVDITISVHGAFL
jgi:hypothetical protein